MSAEYGKLDATIRPRVGKGVARKLRRAGMIPAVIYGQGQENTNLAVDPRLLKKAMNPSLKFNTLFNLALVDTDGQAQGEAVCILTDYQIHPTRDEFIHVDFMRVDLDREVTATIPVEYTGRSAGVVMGGKLRTYRRTVKVAAKPNQIPEKLVVDVTPLEGGQSLRLSSLSIENARLVDHPQTVMAHVDMPRAAKATSTDEGDKK